MKKLRVEELFVAGLFAMTGACQESRSLQGLTAQPERAPATLLEGYKGGTERKHGHGNLRVERAQAQVVATGIPGAGAICQIGTFHLGGPLRDNPAFSPFTTSGQILESKRLLVASASNFGAPLGRADQAPGSVLSIDVGAGAVEVPAAFASEGGQASAAEGRVRIYAANNRAFSNSVFNPSAATASEVSVSLPLGISLNNAFGRPWLANAPGGSAGYGTITVLDPGGAPFKGPPSPVAGGVFAGDLTNRSAASTHGLTTGTLATALLTKSPDGTGRAVFLAANADGSVVQVHVQKGVDGLAPPGSFTALADIGVAAAQSNSPAHVTRVGMVFNWVPTQIVYVTDPLADRILALDLGSDGTLFTARARYLRSPWLDRPVDLAPTSVETAARNFASNTTLGAGSDLYVLNRGDNTIVRMTQAGQVTAVRQVDAPVADFRVAGLAVSPDGRTLWVTATTPGNQGVVLELASFGAGEVTSALLEGAAAAGAGGEIAQGGHIFSHRFTLDQRVGPLFNGRGCLDCHSSPAAGGMGITEDAFVVRFGRTRDGAHDPMLEQGGPVARAHSIRDLGGPCGQGRTGVPAGANVTSRRSAMTLRGSSLIDTILDVAIFNVQAAQPAEVRGRVHLLADGRVGKFGWKAGTPTLVEFMAEALRDEIGITNPLRPDDFRGCGEKANEGTDIDGLPLTALVAFLNTIDPPAPSAACLASPGATLFASIGCASCHTPSLPGPGSPTAAQKPVRLYSDLLLHDLGPEMSDGIVQGSAQGHEFRTAPLWRAADRSHFLHDGRAATLSAAIAAHGGQGAGARSAFQALPAADQQALLAFLGCI